MRIDLYLVQQGYVESRTLAQKLISEGAVTVDDKLIRKASEDVPDGNHTVEVTATADTRFVGRGGLKLEAALQAFPVKVEGCVAADIGASTGGFTDCLLQRGVARVYAVDAGHGQLHPRLLEDERVRSAEGMNARNLTPADLIRIESEWQANHGGEQLPFDGKVDGIVMDVSFISQTLLHPALSGIVKEGGFLIALIKPQFELTKSALNKQGIVKQEKDRKTAVERVLTSAAACGFEAISVIPSPIEGGDGNREFLAYFIKKVG